MSEGCIEGDCAVKESLALLLSSVAKYFYILGFFIVKICIFVPYGDIRQISFYDYRWLWRRRSSSCGDCCVALRRSGSATLSIVYCGSF